MVQEGLEVRGNFSTASGSRGGETVANHDSFRLGEHRLPLYKLLKKFDLFHWMEEAQKALEELKELITKLPVLTSLESGETLLLYVVATTQVVSAALVVEREEPGHVYKVQRSVY
jgi:hypothetical protein